MKLHEAFSPEESKKIYDNFLAIVNDPKRRDRLVRKHGKNAENVAYGTAVNQVKRQAANTIEEPQPEETMEDTRLREMVIDALTEKKKSFPDLTGDGKVTRADILKARGVELDEANLYSGEEWSIEPEGRFWIVTYKTMDGKKEKVFQSEDEARKFTKTLNEDLDLGHQDDEPHMLKADLYRIGKYAMELYKMVDQFEGEQEVDFPHWWQSKIVQAKSMLVSAKHYLDFETKEPQIDAMVDVASEEGAIGENLEDIDYRNRNNMMGGVYDLAKKSKDVESFKDKWYEIYSRGPQDKDADTDEWLEKTYARVMSRVTTEEMTPEKSEKIGMPFKGIAKEGEIDEMSKKQIKKRGKVFDALKDQGMPDKKAGPIATSVAMKEEIKKAILAKLKNK